MPSLRHAATPGIDRAIWPLTSHVDELGRLCVGEIALTDIADEFRTPTYVIDEADFRHRIRRYRAAPWKLAWYMQQGRSCHRSPTDGRSSQYGLLVTDGASLS